MKRKTKGAEEAGRDYATLLRMGWTADSFAEAVDIAAELFAAGDLDAALVAVESARSLAGGSNEAEATELEVLGFELALARADAPRAIGGANSLRMRPGLLDVARVSELRDLVAGSELRAELRQALTGVLDTIVPAAGSHPGGSVLGISGDRPQEGVDELPSFFAEPAEFGEDSYARAELGQSGDAVPDLDDELPYLAPDLDLLADPDAWTQPEGSAGEIGLESENTDDDWAFGTFPVGVGESRGEIQARFVTAALGASPDQAREVCEAGWSFFLMEEFETAAQLFGQALGDPDVRLGAAEGLVRCRLNLAQPAQAIDFLERLEALAFVDGLPEALLYWYGRSAEAVGDGRKARSAYRRVSPDAFPDVQGRLAGLP